jgi:prophage regulatory protein
MPKLVYRYPALKAQYGYARSTIYLLIAQGLWPRPVPLSRRTVGWPEHEVSEVVQARISGMNEDDLRALVSRLHSNRNKVANG